MIDFPFNKYKKFRNMAGVGCQTAIRKKPNAFNLVHQCEFLVRGGLSSEASLGSLEDRCGMWVHFTKQR